ncbi:MAG: glycosyltransferase [Acidobacteria bacterium]|nr:glycosyltransferase [Acidobacteriota bacterium]
MKTAPVSIARQSVAAPRGAAAGTRPVLILTIDNGAAHTKAAEAIAAAWRRGGAANPVEIVEVSTMMSPFARFTHVSLYLWLVKNAPAVWQRIDAYQKGRPATSPDWFYRRECRRLFDFARAAGPAALVATEVGCLEIAALVKRDLGLDVPLAAVNLDYDGDRAWVRPEVDLYCLATESVAAELGRHGAAREKIRVWGVPLAAEFGLVDAAERGRTRTEICEALELRPFKPLILVAGGGEGLGRIEEIVRRLAPLPVQLVVLTGRNARLKARLERIAPPATVRILGWTRQMPDLMKAADFSISKLGLSFYEATACGLPIVALPPPPGAERAQYEFLAQTGIGRAVKTLDELARTVLELLENPNLLRRMRNRLGALGQRTAADELAGWLTEEITKLDV